MARNIVLCDLPDRHAELLPLSYTRPVADFRVGITTIKEKWEAYLKGDYSYLVCDSLKEIFLLNDRPDSYCIAGHVFPDAELCKAILSLPLRHALYVGGELVAFRGSPKEFKERFVEGTGFAAGSPARLDYGYEVDMIRYAFDVFSMNHKALLADYIRLTHKRKSQPLSKTNTLVGPSKTASGTPSVFIEEGASVEGSIINVKEGPVYIGREAEVMEGACIRGALAMCEHSRINMGSKIYGATTLGPFCKVGGELNNVVMIGYSNKAHDGFLGNAVIGEWCNIGAGTNASNLKNDYSKIRIWNYLKRTFMRTDLQFCGTIMGDHTKVGVNCMLNTATVLGVGVNLHGSGFPRAFVPSFSEGSPTGGFSDVSLTKFFEIASRVMARRDKELSDEQRRLFEKIFTSAEQYK